MVQRLYDDGFTVIQAIELVRESFGIGLAEAHKTVSQHPAWQKAEAGNTQHVPCPFCGQSLRTAKARQCRHCKRDWHSEPN